MNFRPLHVCLRNVYTILMAAVQIKSNRTAWSNRHAFVSDKCSHFQMDSSAEKLVWAGIYIYFFFLQPGFSHPWRYFATRTHWEMSLSCTVTHNRRCTFRPCAHAKEKKKVKPGHLPFIPYTPSHWTPAPCNKAVLSVSYRSHLAELLFVDVSSQRPSPTRTFPPRELSLFCNI